jgi:ribose transport system substrate-binding protein
MKEDNGKQMVEGQGEHQQQLEEIVDHYLDRGLSRGELFKKAGLGVLAFGAVAPVLAACGVQENPEDAAAEAGKAAGSGLKMFGTNGGIVSWYVQGQRTAEHWAKQLGVDLTWADGELDSVKQRAKVDNAATKEWDVVAVTAVQAGTILDPVQRMVQAGASTIQMTSNVGRPGEDWGYLTFCEQSSFDMGYQVATQLFEAAGGKGTVIETQGPASQTDAQDRHKGFAAALKNYPDMELLETDFGNWEVGRARSLWETYINKYDEITVGFFQNDDMAFAGLEALKSAGREGDTLIGGVDAMPEAIRAVQDGRFVATHRHSSCRIHMYAVVLGTMHKLGVVENVPKKVVVDGPLVTKDNAESLLALEQAGLYLQ